MEYQHIITFLKVLERNSFSKAAEDLGYSQAAITIQIKKLEESLGVKLFERINKRIRLTDDGALFVEHANTIMRSFENAMHMKKDAIEIKSTIRIGTVGSLGHFFLSEIISKFNQAFPNCTLKIYIESGKILNDMLRRNEIDVMYTIDRPIHDTDFNTVFKKAERVCFVSANEKLFDKKHTLSEISKYPFLLTERGHAYRSELEEVLAMRNIDLNVVLEVGDLSIILQSLTHIQGVAFLPEFTIESTSSYHKIKKIDVDVDDVKIYRQAFIHKQKYINDQLKTLLSIMDSVDI